MVRDSHLVLRAPTKAPDQMDLAGLPGFAAGWSAPGATGPRRGRLRFVSPHRSELTGRVATLLISQSFTGHRRFQDGLNLHEEVSSRDRSCRSRPGSSLRPLALWLTSSRSIRPATLVALAAFLVLPGNESALVQATTPAARQQAARAAVDMPVVLTQVPAGRTLGELRPEPRAGAAADLDPAARLVLLAPDGSTRVLTSHFHSACDADVAVDGGRILFAGKTAAGGTGISTSWTCKAWRPGR